MRRTVRGRGARGFIESSDANLSALRDVLSPAPVRLDDVEIDVAALSRGLCIVTGPPDIASKLDLVNDLLRAGLFDGKPSPLLCMRPGK